MPASAQSCEEATGSAVQPVNESSLVSVRKLSIGAGPHPQLLRPCVLCHRCGFAKNPLHGVGNGAVIRPRWISRQTKPFHGRPVTRHIAQGIQQQDGFHRPVQPSEADGGQRIFIHAIAGDSGDPAGLGPFLLAPKMTSTGDRPRSMLRDLAPPGNGKRGRMVPYLPSGHVRNELNTLWAPAIAVPIARASRRAARSMTSDWSMVCPPSAIVVTRSYLYGRLGYSA